MKPCTECPRYSTCTELCDKAKRYVAKDYVSQRETTHPEWMLDLLSVHSKPINGNDVPHHLNMEMVKRVGMTEMQAKCLRLFYCDGLKYWEIARKVNRKVSTINNYIYRGKCKIRKFLSDNRENQNGV